MTRSEALLALRQDLASVPELDLLDDPGQLVRCSRDAYDYSPVLSPKLERIREHFLPRCFYENDGQHHLRQTNERT